jgi:hypothetical protein
MVFFPMLIRKVYRIYPTRAQAEQNVRDTPDTQVSWQRTGTEVPSLWL